MAPPVVSASRQSPPPLVSSYQVSSYGYASIDDLIRLHMARMHHGPVSHGDMDGFGPACARALHLPFVRQHLLLRQYDAHNHGHGPKTHAPDAQTHTQDCTLSCTCSHGRWFMLCCCIAMDTGDLDTRRSSFTSCHKRCVHNTLPRHCLTHST